MFHKKMFGMPRKNRKRHWNFCKKSIFTFSLSFMAEIRGMLKNKKFAISPCNSKTKSALKKIDCKIYNLHKKVAVVKTASLYLY